MFMVKCDADGGVEAGFRITLMEGQASAVYVCLIVFFCLSNKTRIGVMVAYPSSHQGSLKQNWPERGLEGPDSNPGFGIFFLFSLVSLFLRCCDGVVSLR